MHSAALALTILTLPHTANAQYLFSALSEYATWPHASALRAWVDPREHEAVMTRSAWTSTPEFYAVNIRTIPVEAGSMAAHLSPDGTTLQVSAKRKIEGCSCQESIIGSVQLPFTPRPDDIDLVLDEQNGALEVKLARHSKADEPTPLPIKKLNQKPSILRFVPHESAVPASTASSEEPRVAAKEQRLLDKFRAISTATTAFPSTASGSDSKEKVKTESADLPKNEAKVEGGQGPTENEKTGEK